MPFFDVGRLCASILWGSVGSALFLYGKKQGVLLPLAGGTLIVILSIVARSALLMSAGGVAVLAAMGALHALGW